MADESAEPASSGSPTLVVVGAVIAALALLVGLLVAVGDDDGGPVRDRRGEAEVAADEWLRAWIADDRPALRELLAESAPALDGVLDGFRDGLQPGLITAAGGAARITGDTATVPVAVTVDLPGLGLWEYEGALDLVDVEVPVENGETEPRWKVAFSPATVHPRLTGARRLERSVTWPERGRLLASDGSPLPGGGTVGAIVGSVRPADAARVEELGPPYGPGVPVGVSGLQAGFERPLAGRPSGEVRLVEGDRLVRLEATFTGTPGADVRTTLDLRLLEAASAALGDGAQPAAMVVIQPSTGAVRAVANRPGNGFNRALAGRYPPGSTFKVVTATALLANGVTPDTRIDCPDETTVNGRRIRNAEGEALGNVAFREAFFRSCNTAFVQLASRLPAQALIDAARFYGFDAAPGFAAATSQFPEPTGVVDQVAASIGQGRVLATPMQMASVAATVAAGTYRQPHLVEGAEVETRAMDPGHAATLQELMRLVVAQGTGTRAQLPGAPVAGKTGTAEFGTEVPLRTHAWFIGFRNDLAVAVLVEDGGFGGQVAAPLAADFLRRAG